MGRAGTVVILAAGQGTRMKSPAPKVLQPLCGRPMVAWVLDQALALDPARILLVLGPGGEAVQAALAHEPGMQRVRCVLQAERLGTGHALQSCMPELQAAAGEAGPVVVLYGDMPLLLASALGALCERFSAPLQQGGAGGKGLCLLTARPQDPTGLGRVLRASDGACQGIVEERDATPAQRAIGETNVGVYAFEAAFLRQALPRLSNTNAQREYYLTDVVGLAVAAGLPACALELEQAQDALGVNTLVQLAAVRRVLQLRILEQHLAGGVYIEDPDSTYIDYGVSIGSGTKILPCTVIRTGVKIGAGCEVGPFTHLRVGTQLEDGAEVGNFTETKQARLGPHSKAKHLAYLGDVTIGERVNIGAGTIVANYDGKAKHPTVIEDRAFVGSGSVLIAPTRIGAGARTGAGAVVTRGSQIPAGETWVGVPAHPLAPKPASGASSPSPSSAPRPQSPPS